MIKNINAHFKKTLKFTKLFFFLIITGFLLLINQNCSGFEALRRYSGQDSNASNTINLMDKTIWTLNKTNLKEKNMIFYVNPKLFGNEANYGWFYEHNGSPEGCSVNQYSEYVNAAQINCLNPGVLHLTLIILQPDLEISERINLVVEVSGAPQYATITDSELYLSADELYLNFDGSPGEAYTGPDPYALPVTPTPNEFAEGERLYSVNCSACHGSIATTSRRGRNANQIQAAILNVGDMNRLSFLSSDELSKISAALN